MKRSSRYILILLALVILASCGGGKKTTPSTSTSASPPEFGYTNDLDDNIEDIELASVTVFLNGVKIKLSEHFGYKKKKGKLYGEEIDDIDKYLRAATWNVRQLTDVTAKNTIGFRFYGFDSKGKLKKTKKESLNKKEAIFRTLKQNGIHIAALQEIHSKSKNYTFTGLEGYAVITGDWIKPHSGKKGTSFHYQYCPVTYRPNLLACNDDSVDKGARTHWVSCHVIKKPKVKFFFGCSHFDNGSSPIGANLKSLFSNLQKNSKGPNITKTSNKDVFILGLDANSNPQTKGKHANKWEKHLTKWPAVKTPMLKPKNTATKMFKRKNNGKPFMKVVQDLGSRVIDFLIHYLDGGSLKYIPGSMQVMSPKAVNADMKQTKWKKDNAKQFWLEQLRISDHFLVKADYVYK